MLNSEYKNTHFIDAHFCVRNIKLVTCQVTSLRLKMIIDHPNEYLNHTQRSIFFNSVETNSGVILHYMLLFFLVISNLVITVPYLNPSLQPVFYAFLSCSGAAQIIFLYLFRNSDPGFVPVNTDPRLIQDLIAPVDMPTTDYAPIVREVEGEQQLFCRACKIWRDGDFDHCWTCRRCVRRFDHHCGVLGGCVGLKNHRFFIGYLMLLVFHGAFGLASVCLCIPVFVDAHWNPIGQSFYIAVIGILNITAIWGGLVCTPHFFLVCSNRTAKQAFGRSLEQRLDGAAFSGPKPIIVTDTVSLAVESLSLEGWRTICCADFSWHE